jgi:hypothetical protein
MGERPIPARAKEGHVVPFRRGNGPLRAAVRTTHSLGASARTIRPRDVLLLLPLIIPLAVAILLGLLGWFVAWLAVVAFLTGAIVGADLLDLLRRRMRTSATP